MNTSLNKPTPPTPAELLGWCAFTWAPSPKFQWASPRFTYQKQLEVLSLLKKSHEFVFYPEFYKNGGMHWHGMIRYKPNVTMRQKVTYFKSTLPSIKHKGHVVIKTNLNHKWIEYMTKDHELMEGVLEMNDVSFNSHMKPSAVIPEEECPNDIFKWLDYMPDKMVSYDDWQS